MRPLYLIPCVLAVLLPVLRASERPDDVAFVLRIEGDWVEQESRRGRAISDVAAIGEAINRASDLIVSLERAPHNLALGDATRQLNALRRSFTTGIAAGDFEKLPVSERESFYKSVRWLGRGVALQHPELVGRSLVVMKQRRFICQMFHEYAAYYANYFGVSGGGIYRLNRPGYSLETVDLVGDCLPRGNFASPALAPDGKTLYFAFCEIRDLPRPHGTTPDWQKFPHPRDVAEPFSYYNPDRVAFHIFAIDLAEGSPRQLTFGPFDDTEPCPLPSGRIAFMSSRRQGYIRCNSTFEPLETSTLHLMDADGGNLRRLSSHETNEWSPSVMNDGRIVYTRWDYVDRDAVFFHGIWACNPDGSAPAHLFGSYNQRINACYEPTPIPHSSKIAFIAGAHHAVIGGSLVLFDPNLAVYNAETGEDTFECIESLTPDVAFSETSAGRWAQTFYRTPCPLSEDHYLIAFSGEPLPGYGTKHKNDARCGIYYLDRFGNQELIYDDPDISCIAPILLPREGESLEIPPDIASPLIAQLAEDGVSEGEYIVTDVRQSLLPLPPNRPIESLRVYTILPKQKRHAANDPRLGYANAESPRVLLGTVPVESDGSVYFRAPAGEPLYFQAVDRDGIAVQTMRSTSYLQPGETRACVGCHEPLGAALPRATVSRVKAMQRPPSTIAPGPAGTNPLEYQTLIQPIFDARCVSCHNGTENGKEHSLRLTGEPEKAFTVSYNNLRPFVRWYEWGGATIAPIVSRPGQSGADMSRLTSILRDETHRDIPLDDAERRAIFLWLDANAPFWCEH